MNDRAYPNRQQGIGLKPIGESPCGFDSHRPDLKKIYGPYQRKDGRYHIVLTFKNGRKQTLSYPKWIMECHLGRVLKANETVDHIDRDFTNNALTNLRIITKRKHAIEDAKRVRQVQIICKWCGKTAFKSGRNLRHNGKLGKAGPFCGRSCAGKYIRAVQLGQIEPLPPQPREIPSEYYYLEKNGPVSPLSHKQLKG